MGLPSSWVSEYSWNLHGQMNITGTRETEAQERGTHHLIPPELGPNHIKTELVGHVGSGTGEKLSLCFIIKGEAVITVLSQGYCSGHRAVKLSPEPQETSLALYRADQSTAHPG